MTKYVHRLALGSLSPFLALVAVACGDARPAADCCAEVAAAKPLPGESVWQLDRRWQDRSGRSRRLGELRGQVVVAAMIFTHCRYACPTLVGDMQEIRSALGDVAGVRYLLVSMDPDRDRPEVLRQWAEERGLGDDWTLLCGPQRFVRELSAALGVRLERAPNGDFAHSNVITVLDRDGCIRHQQVGLDADNHQTIEALHGLLKP